MTIVDLARLFGRDVAAVRAWRTRWADWPEPVGRAGRAGASYDLAEVQACIARHERLADSTDRWSLERVARQYGLSLHAAYALRRRGALPAPDGFQARRSWWSPQTVRSWATSIGVPPTAWTALRVVEHTGRPIAACIAAGLTPDGIVHQIRWWHPSSVLTWQGRHGAAAPPEAEGAPTEVGRNEGQLDLRDVATETGLSYWTLKVYNSRGLLPPADGQTGLPRPGRPCWRADTIRAWVDDRQKSEARRLPRTAS